MEYNQIYRDSKAISIYIGKRRSGKDLSMVADTEDNIRKFPNMKVYSNIHLTFCDYIPLTYDVLIELYKSKTEFINCIFLISECHQYFDSRNFGSIGNKVISYFAGQISKRGNVLRGTTHFFEMLDLRIRNYCEELIICHKGLLINNIWNQLQDYNVTLTEFENECLWIKQNRFLWDLKLYNFEWFIQPDKFVKASPIFLLYNTYEITNKI